MADTGEKKFEAKILPSLVGIIFSVPFVLRKCSSELLRIKTFLEFEELLLGVSLEGE